METFRFLLFGFAGVSVVFWVAIIAWWHASMLPRFFKEDTDLNSISFHPPVMIITTLVFFYIRRKILLTGKKH